MTASKEISKRALKQSEIFTHFEPCFTGFLNFPRLRARCLFNASSFSMVIHSLWPDDLRTSTKFWCESFVTLRVLYASFAFM